MERGKKLAAMAKKMQKEVVNAPLLTAKKQKIAKSLAEGCEANENSRGTYNCVHSDGSVLKPLPYETITSFDVGISGDMLTLLQQQQIQTSNEAICMINSLEDVENDEDIFHETDFDDSDYIPSEDSDSDPTSESTRADLLSKKQLPDMPTTSKASNKLNKNLGKEYYTYRNKKVPAREFQPIGQCKKMCHEKINCQQQESIFKKYWNLGDYNKRRLYISNMIDIQTKKSETLNKALNSRNRQYVYLYYFEIYGERSRVCKKCFLKIFGETDSSIKNINMHKKFEWKEVRWMRYEKSRPGVLQYKSSLHQEESFNQLDINPRRSTGATPQMVASYTSPLAISQNKKRDLLDMLPLISTHLHSFYRAIKAEGECPVEIDPDLDGEEI